jgi:hypothetical protein
MTLAVGTSSCSNSSRFGPTSYVCQLQALSLRPWQLPPGNCDEDEENPRDPNGQNLLRKMLAAGVSRYDPSPLAALKRKRK